MPLTLFKDFEQCIHAERIGFVFPCHFGNALDIVLDFKKQILSLIDKKGIYVFVVITYANSTGGSYHDFKEDIDA
ncbi:hypothetical protein [Konateibacter massiliensis]|uniref:hypothetical protein n=1 Tax=Konateibacter massiliensis TaxID=2002841 RepID=UPI000C14A117|nr:hypothetical protein [Konateibacter massiliensis]